MTQVIIHVKGGPGSGFYGHAGRPGKVGGSAPAVISTGESYADLPKPVEIPIRNWENTFSAIDRVYHNEYAILVHKSGEVLWTGQGDSQSVTVPRLMNEEGAILSHNHPPGKIEYGADQMEVVPTGAEGISQPPSPSDILTAVARNYHQIRAVGYDRGKRIVYTLTRPEKGWPTLDQMKDALFFYYDRSKEIMRNKHSLHNMPREEFSKDVLSHLWKSLDEAELLEYYEGVP